MDRNNILNMFPKNLIWAELGVFEGEYSKIIHKSTSPKKMYLVDTFPNMMISGDKDGLNIKNIDISLVPYLLNSYFIGYDVEIKKMTTNNFLKEMHLKSEKIDVVYIDADHSYECVKNDLYMSLKIMNKNGYICGHDYSDKMFPGVTDAVNEFCKENDFKIHILTDDLLPSYIIKL
jgi:hypothetical protein